MKTTTHTQDGKLPERLLRWPANIQDAKALEDEYEYLANTGEAKKPYYKYPEFTDEQNEIICKYDEDNDDAFFSSNEILTQDEIDEYIADGWLVYPEECSDINTTIDELNEQLEMHGNIVYVMHSFINR